MKIDDRIVFTELLFTFLLYACGIHFYLSKEVDSLLQNLLEYFLTQVSALYNVCTMHATSVELACIYKK